MKFTYKHKNGDVKTLILTEKDMANLIDTDVLFDEFCIQNCKCEPVGETNVVECGCEDYLTDFELQDDSRYYSD
jgi:hypothetical protein